MNLKRARRLGEGYIAIAQDCSERILIFSDEAVLNMAI